VPKVTKPRKVTAREAVVCSIRDRFMKLYYITMGFNLCFFI
jgi:hypothetical protein